MISCLTNPLKHLTKAYQEWHQVEQHDSSAGMTVCQASLQHDATKLPQLSMKKEFLSVIPRAHVTKPLAIASSFHENLRRFNPALSSQEPVKKNTEQYVLQKDPLTDALEAERAINELQQALDSIFPAACPQDPWLSAPAAKSTPFLSMSGKKQHVAHSNPLKTTQYPQIFEPNLSERASVRSHHSALNNAESDKMMIPFEQSSGWTQFPLNSAEVLSCLDSHHPRAPEQETAEVQEPQTRRSRCCRYLRMARLTK
ncbi:MAG: hypothetical protein VKK59_00050 [Vampirovibrionales bacterium]|nr:hypothetical protein [Vampirovibrionales bacterium]